MVVNRKLLLILLLICLTSILAGQKVKVDASLNKTTVFKSDPIIYTIAVTTSYRAKISEPGTPAVKGLRFSHVSTSSRSSTSYQNLRATSTYVLEFRYQYFPVSTGRYTFPAQSVVVDGQAYITAPVTVEVKADPTSQAPGSSPPSQSYNWNPFDQWNQWEPDASPREEGKTFILALPEQQSVYRGQPALVSYYLYTNQDVRSYSNESVNDYGGYGKEIYGTASVLQFDRATYRGQNYQRALLKTYAIFPQRTGDLKVPRLSATVRWNYHSFFEQAVDSAPATISVRDLPPGAPSNFYGALGRFDVSGTLSRNNARVGQAITYTLRIRGLGNFNQFSAPKFTRSADLQVSAPLFRDQLKGGCDGTRELVYTVIPRRSGSYSLPALNFCWLDTETGKYMVFNATQDVITVSPGGTASGSSLHDGTGSASTMHPIIERDEYPQYYPLYSRWWFWLLVIVMAGSLAISASVARRHRQILNDPKELSLRTADREFTKLRSELAAHPRKGSREFYSLAQKGLLAYVVCLCHLPSHLPTDEVLGEATAQGFPADLAVELKAFLSDCQQELYSPSAASDHGIERNLTRFTDIAVKLQQLRSKGQRIRNGGTQ